MDSLADITIPEGFDQYGSTFYLIAPPDSISDEEKDQVFEINLLRFAEIVFRLYHLSFNVSRTLHIGLVKLAFGSVRIQESTLLGQSTPKECSICTSSLEDIFSQNFAPQVKLLPRWLHAAHAAYKVNVDDIAHMLGIHKNNVLCFRKTPIRYCPSYYIAVLHNTRHILLAIRGTNSLEDALTGLAAEKEKFQSGYGHKGIVNAARLIRNEVYELLMHELESYHSHGVSYQVVLVGHSLGASTASLLYLDLIAGRNSQQVESYAPSLLLSEKNVKCFAFAPCPCLDSVSCMNDFSCKGVLSVVNGSDIISRLSNESLENLCERVMFKYSSSATSTSTTSVVAQHVTLGEPTQSQKNDKTELKTLKLKDSVNQDSLTMCACEEEKPQDSFGIVGTILNLNPRQGNPIPYSLIRGNRLSDISCDPWMLHDHRILSVSASLNQFVEHFGELGIRRHLGMSPQVP